MISGRLSLGIASSQGKKPEAPTNFSASAGNAQAALSWNAVTYSGKDTVQYFITTSTLNHRGKNIPTPWSVAPSSTGTGKLSGVLA